MFYHDLLNVRLRSLRTNRYKREKNIIKYYLYTYILPCPSLALVLTRVKTCDALSETSWTRFLLFPVSLLINCFNSTTCRQLGKALKKKLFVTDQSVTFWAPPPKAKTFLRTSEEKIGFFKELFRYAFQKMQNGLKL